MTIPIPVAASHAVQAARVSHIAAVVTALIVAALIIAVFKILGRALTPKPKSQGRSGLPYSAPARRR